VSVHCHIGHHFFGAGNFGDDLMLAGFLESCREYLPRLHLTCCTPFDRNSQQKRFPGIEWLEYSPGVREATVRSCDAWIGLGDTPFQTDVGRWFLDHLDDELDLCRRYHKPMYFLGVGVNNREALLDRVASELLRYASHIWSRDDNAGNLFAAVCGSSKVTSGADLAHPYLETVRAGECEPGVAGYVLNFEDSEKFRASAFAGWVASTRNLTHRWLFQEVRNLKGSETGLLEALPDDVIARLDQRKPDYGGDTLQQYLTQCGRPEFLITSRYHAALVGAWMGSRIVVIERNLKLAGCASQLRLTSLPSLDDSERLQSAVLASRGTDREMLASLASAARSECRECIGSLVE
jgi:polysaccharide pyruvyl transferase WcaK-like protein